VEPQIICPKCERRIDPSFYFCPNCGKKIKEKPVSIELWPQIKLYLISVMLPPLGIGLTIRYLRSESKKANVIGVVSLILTVSALIYVTWYSINFVNEFNKQLNSELGKYEQIGF
jgi:hypothetical protein